MTGSIFINTLRRNWRQMIWWGLGLALLGSYGLIVIPDVKALEQYAAMAQNFPPALLQMFGAQDAAALATPEGFLNLVFYGYALLILAVYAVMAGLSVTANEEDSGILDVVLALPLARTRLMLEKLAAFAVITVGIAIIGLMGLLLGTAVTSLEINRARLVEGVINMLPATLMMIALTACLASVLRRKSTAIAAASGIIVASYFLDFIGRAVANEIVNAAQKLSFFTYYDSQDVILNGLNAGNMALLLALTAILVAAAVYSFNRRDVGV
jgi:ABC-2 type transport system permease protein